MQIHYAKLDECAAARGVVVVIDVVRAFTTAAYAFGAGAQRILLVGTPAQALELRSRMPEALVMGEVGGLPVPGFDLWNSPSEVRRLDLRGKTLIQRTSAGTQGVVRSVQAEHLLAGSFAVAGATLRAVRALQPAEVTFVITGAQLDDPRYGQEDRACAEYLAAHLLGQPPDPRAQAFWLEDFREVHRLAEFPEPLRARFEADLALAQRIDAFDFALPVHREGELLVMEKSA